MTPKEKAVELVDKFRPWVPKYYDNPLISYQKECALMAVDEILDFMMKEDILTKTCHYVNSHWTPYWIKVKEEIKNL